MKALSDLIVIDLTHMLSGPFGGMLLADLGARTIKVEPPGKGELTRGLLAKDPKNSLNGMGAYFLTLNRNKESVCIDLKSEDGLALFYELVKKADIVLSNFSPGVTARLKIDYGVLSKVNERIITCSVTGFGESGPAYQRPAFDMVAQGYGGGMSITGQAGAPPTRAGIPIGDLGGGMFSAVGMLAALHARERTGRGQHIDISMQDCQISLINYMATMYFLSGDVPSAIGNSHFVHVPYNTYPTKDLWLIIAIITNETWMRFRNMMGINELQDEAFDLQPGRLAAKDFIEEKISARLKQESCDFWLEKLAEVKIPCAPVNDLEHALNDVQVRARNMVVTVNHPEGGEVQMTGNPIKMSASDEDTYAPPPLLGQHTDNVLRDLLGKSESDIATLRAAGTVG
ncbi:MAG: CaiB/BaiF CoA-transferase family protein [Proteobacteria bacterium]|nr:CaiB/BaiF CoA-transferase family protein [Pseudomonadota bacterium]MDA1357394.1 CaiB/BaiF CoA-transferase family protein [Pseudomonadota bacterium]